MADSVQRRGRDTFVNQARPDQAFQKSKWLGLTSGQKKVFVHLPLPGVRKRTIEQAVLSGVARGAMAAQTLTANPIDVDWTPRKTTWNNQPALRGGAVSQAQPALADGGRFEIDVTAHVQAVANGAKHFGWQITTNSTSLDNYVRGFEDAGGAWVLTVDFIEAPEAPTDLSPNGNVVGVRPVLTFEFTDLGGESTEQAALQVQVNSTATESGSWDSGEVAATLPEYDLAPTGWPTPASGATRFWRVRVKDGAGYWSDWSDWAQFTYAPKPVLTVTNPATGIVWDPTPTIAASIGAGTIVAYRIKVADPDDKSKVLYDSGKLPGNGTAALAHVIPFRNDKGRRILRDDRDYQLQVRVWDRLDREATPGDPTWTQTWVTFRMDDDVVPTPPQGLVAVQVGDTPRARLTWSRPTGVARGWVVLDGGEVIERLDADEVTQDGFDYELVLDTLAPFVQHALTVKAIDDGTGKQTLPTNTAYLAPRTDGVWLLGDDTEVKLSGLDVTGFRTIDKRTRYSPPGLPYDIDIVHAFQGVVGTFAGAIAAETAAEWETQRDVILAMKEASEREVRLVYATRNVGVKLRDVSVSPSPAFLEVNMLHDVTFEAQQTSGFEVEV